jgi:hypothetical protein
MSNKTLEVREATEEDLELEEEGIGNEDYGFIIGPDGELKTMFLPEGFMLDPPPQVRKILRIFGIKDVNVADGMQPIH